MHHILFENMSYDCAILCCSSLYFLQSLLKFEAVRLIFIHHYMTIRYNEWIKLNLHWFSNMIEGVFFVVYHGVKITPKWNSCADMNNNFRGEKFKSGFLPVVFHPIQMNQMIIFLTIIKYNIRFFYVFACLCCRKVRMGWKDVQAWIFIQNRNLFFIIASLQSSVAVQFSLLIAHFLFYSV